MLMLIHHRSLLKLEMVSWLHKDLTPTKPKIVQMKQVVYKKLWSDFIFFFKNPLFSFFFFQLLKPELIITSGVHIVPVFADDIKSYT